MTRRPIGVFDSGVGGLTVFRALERALPAEWLIYLGDTARVPYGNRSAETVVRYTLEAARFLANHDVQLLVVACNTASSVALEPLARDLGLPVVGVIEPGAAQAVEHSQSGRIGVIGTRATIASGAYPAALRARRPAIEVTSRACPLFVPLAEEGLLDDEIALAVAERYLEPLWRADVDTLVLGCTHYPLLAPVIAQVMGPAVRLVDSAAAVAAEVARRLAESSAQSASASSTTPTDRPEHRFYVTDQPGPFQDIAERFLGRPIRLERVDLAGDNEQSSRTGREQAKEV